VIPAILTDETMARWTISSEVHRPAHTLVEVCTVGSGMRVGRGLHVELTSIIRSTGGFQPLRLEGSFLAAEAWWGGPKPVGAGQRGWPRTAGWDKPRKPSTSDDFAHATDCGEVSRRPGTG
jgi:hypothetical protein